MSRPADHAQRTRALETDGSFIVQAPAGSGKTELLIQRLLALLGVVGQPEEILALTFTRKAAAEMRQRVLIALRQASDEIPVEAEHARLTRQLATRVLQRDARLGWRLLDNPARLQLQTIDSLCARLVRRLPWLSGFGAPPEVAEDPRPLYREASEHLLDQLGRRGPATAALELLLEHLDNRLELLRDLLVDMLGRRDQWLRHLLGRRQAEPRGLLEEGLRRFVESRLLDLEQSLPPGLGPRLLPLARYAAEQREAAGKGEGGNWFLHSEQLPQSRAEDLPGWLALAELLLTQSGDLRKKLNVNQGFPPKDSGQKAAMEELLADLTGLPLVRQLAGLRDLPGTSYLDREWRLLEGLITLLPLAVVELEQVFRAVRQTDFIAIAGAARAALGSADAPEELLLQLDSRISHLLVDEFQDTSYGQYLLLELLTSGWQPDDGRTLFVVGDPMQSIYRFREAEVGLYLRARRRGLGTLRLEPLQLSVNFRSQADLVDWFNQTFAGLFPAKEDEARGAVRFSTATSARTALGGLPAVRCFAYADRQDTQEAEQVVALVRDTLAENPQGTVAILVRARSHLGEVTAALQRAGIRFVAQETIPLSQRPVISDLRALTRALLHPGDRVAWLSLLRAPWCGLELDDLLWLCDASPQTAVIELLRQPRPQQELFAEPSADSRQRLQRVSDILQRALVRRGGLPLRRLVEATWLELGGPACADPAEIDDAGQFLRLLETLEEGGELPRLESLDEGLERLYAAPDPLADGRVQLMTIHKSKGLEFDTVILPGLGRATVARERTLLRWLEHPDFELLLAPQPAIGGGDDGQTYRAIGTLLREKDELESLRLLYVAATRARRHLCLLGHLPAASGPMTPLNGSLLQIAWPSLQQAFEAGLSDLPPPPVETASAAPALRRLPATWQLPEFAPAVAPTGEGSVTASGTAHLVDAVSRRFGLESEAGRLLGQVVHGWLERCAEPSFRDWFNDATAALPELIGGELNSLGIAMVQLPDYTAKVLAALNNALTGRHACWLFDDYPEAAVEWPLAGVIDEQLVQAVIDRTFVDAQQVRWVIDYKTSEPRGGQDQEEFLIQEAQRYRPQLELYAQLLTRLEPDRQVRGGLYFPLLDVFQELSFD